MGGLWIRMRPRCHSEGGAGVGGVASRTGADGAEVEGLLAHGGEGGGGFVEERLVAGGQEDELAVLGRLLAAKRRPTVALVMFILLNSIVGVMCLQRELTTRAESQIR